MLSRATVCRGSIFRQFALRKTGNLEVEFGVAASGNRRRQAFVLNGCFGRNDCSENEDDSSLSITTANNLRTGQAMRIAGPCIITSLLAIAVSGCSTGPFGFMTSDEHDTGLERGSAEWWAERALDPPGVRQRCKKGKMWPVRPRPTGETSAVYSHLPLRNTTGHCHTTARTGPTFVTLSTVRNVTAGLPKQHSTTATSKLTSS